MDPKILMSYLQQMQSGASAPQAEPAGDPSTPDNTPAHENAESPELEKAEGSEEDAAGGGEQYSHADMIAHHDSIAGLIQVLLNMTTRGPKGAALKMSSPSGMEAKQGTMPGGQRGGY